MPKKIGIFGGTFDPPHLGHLIVAQEVRDKLKLDRIFFIPASLPPHKKKVRISEAFHRLRMVQLATQDNPNFKVLDLELKREGHSYTVDTLKALRKRYPQAQFFLILGLDNLNHIHTWKKPEEIFKLSKVVFITRPGITLNKTSKWLNYSRLLDVKEIDISSTDIRERIKKDKPIKYLVPEKVLQYIQRHNLYK